MPFRGIDGKDGKASLQLACELSEYFEVPEAEARKVAAEVGRAVKRWRSEAAGMGLTSKEIGQMSSAFEHKDLESALSMG